MPEPWGELLGIVAFVVIVIILHFLGRLIKLVRPPSPVNRDDQIFEEVERVYGAPW